MVRARFAAAAQHYNRKEWHSPRQDNHTYSLPPSADGHERHAKFCNSENHNFRIPGGQIKISVFEGAVPCNATTPIGHAIACPHLSTKTLGGSSCLGCNDASVPDCHTVYVGHNVLGNEMHWLPAPFLQNWWNTRWALDSDEIAIDKGFESLFPHSKTLWCSEYKKRRPVPFKSNIKYIHNSFYPKCSNVVAPRMDNAFLRYWRKQTISHNYSPIYSSLPVHRAILLREPFSWLLSRFSWNLDWRGKFACDDIESATRIGPTFEESGWAFRMCLEHMLYLCGEDCISRYEYGIMPLEEIETQAESNLRNSFSVVGLLNETDTFYEMLTRRIAYLDMSLHPQVKGKAHRSFASKRCSLIFKNETFQQRLKAELPILESLIRLYQVGVEVNRFQFEELLQCQ